MPPVSSPQAPASSQRNAQPILDILTRVLAERRAVLEIASGSGYHAATFARALPHLVWQPSDPDAAARESIAAYVAETGLPNLRPPLALDVAAPEWPVEATEAIVCINMIHISPWEATLGLFQGAARLMPERGTMVTYGPYSIGGDFLAESNTAFDQSLRSRNPAWGIRDVNDVARVAANNGFRLDETIRMPANNLTLIFSRG